MRARVVADDLDAAVLLTREEFRLGVSLRATAVFDEWAGRMMERKTLHAEAISPEVFDLLYGRIAERKSARRRH